MVFHQYTDFQRLGKTDSMEDRSHNPTDISRHTMPPIYGQDCPQLRQSLRISKSAEP